MNSHRHNERLLTDVLGEGMSVGFRDAMLDETLRLARRRRSIRRVRGPASVLAVLALTAVLVWQRFPASRVPASLSAKPYLLVRTQPLATAACVNTHPFSPDSLITSVRTENVVVTALSGIKVQDMTDEELLALAPKPAALVRFGPHSAELVFVNREDGEEKRKY